jgi:hypothetical protein
MQFKWGTLWCTWLRHSISNRNVASSNPGGVIRNIHCLIISGHSIINGSMQTQTQISGRYISLEIKVTVCRDDILTSFICKCLENLGKSNYSNAQILAKSVLGEQK